MNAVLTNGMLHEVCPDSDPTQDAIPHRPQCRISTPDVRSQFYCAQLGNSQCVRQNVSTTLTVDNPTLFSKEALKSLKLKIVTCLSVV